MMQIIKDIIGFIKTLSQIDWLLYIAVLVLVILIVSLIYIIKNSEEEEEASISNENKEDLKTIVSTIENKQSPALTLTDYEAEQEEKAIISYEELLEKNKLGKIKYEEEKIANEEITIKKINLDQLIENQKETNQNQPPLCYEKEEEYLKKLHALNNALK